MLLWLEPLTPANPLFFFFWTELAAGSGSSSQLCYLDFMARDTGFHLWYSYMAFIFKLTWVNKWLCLNKALSKYYRWNAAMTTFVKVFSLIEVWETLSWFFYFEVNFKAMILANIEWDSSYSYQKDPHLPSIGWGLIWDGVFSRSYRREKNNIMWGISNTTI